MQENILLSSHFKLREFTESATAEKHGIDNTPPAETVANLKALCLGTLEPLREKLGLPIVITSGYRCKALNDRIVHHSRKSQHMLGQAADFYVSGCSRRELLIIAFRLIIEEESIDYDQLILYPSFIHVSYVSREKNRRKIIKANGQGAYCSVSREVALSYIL